MEIWTIKRLLEWGRDYFAQHDFPNPKLEIEYLLAHVLQCKRLELYLQIDKPLNQEELSRLKAMVLKRKTWFPLQYITGKAPFFGFELNVGPGCLIPRPETEVLVENLLELSLPQTPKVLDLFCGSGAIGIAFAKLWQKKYGTQPELVLGDISEEALIFARENVEHYLTNFSVETLQTDSFAQIQGRSFDLIVANPPYVSAFEYADLPLEVRQYEPRQALEAPEEGLFFYKQLLQESYMFLETNGYLCFEIGETQQDSILSFDHSQLQWLETYQDFAGRDRGMIFKKVVAKVNS